MTRDGQEGVALPAARATHEQSQRAVSAVPVGIANAWPFRVRVKAGRSNEDPEKLVTPGVLYMAKSEGGLTVRLIALGWWDWHITFLFAFRRRPAPKPEQDHANG